MAEYGIDAKINADASGFVKAMTEAAKSAEGLGKTVGNMANKLDQNTSDMQKGLSEWGVSFETLYKNGSDFFKKFGIDVDKFADKIGTTGKSLTLFAGTAVLAITAAIKTLKILIAITSETAKAYNEVADSENKLALANRNNPLVDTADTKKLEAYAKDIEALGFSYKETVDQMGYLVTTGKTTEQVQETMAAAADYAAANNVSLSDAVKTLNATYSGTAGRLGQQIPALKSLTEEQLKHGDAIKIVEEYYKGMAKELVNADTQAKNAKDDFKAAVGAITAPTYDAWNRFFASFYESLAKLAKSVSDTLDLINVNNIKFLKQMESAATKTSARTGESALTEQSTASLEYAIELLGKKNKLSAEEKNLQVLATAELSRRDRIEKDEATTEKKASDAKAKSAADAKTRDEAAKKRAEDALKLAQQKAEFTAKWADKEAEAETSAMQKEYDASVKSAEERKASYAELADIVDTYNARMAESYTASVDKQRAASLAEAKAKGADAETVAEINKYYDDLITSNAEDQEKKREDILKNYSSFADGIASNISVSWSKWAQSMTDTIDANAKDWSDVFTSISDAVTKIGEEALVDVGKSLVNGSASWESYGAIALNALAQVLQAIGAQLAAMAVAAIASEQYAKGIALAAGAAAAFVASGVIAAFAETEQAAYDAATGVKTITVNLEELKKAIAGISTIQSFVQTAVSKGFDVSTITANVEVLKKNIVSASAAVSEAEKKQAEAQKEAYAAAALVASLPFLSISWFAAVANAKSKSDALTDATEALKNAQNNLNEAYREYAALEEAEKEASDSMKKSLEEQIDTMEKEIAEYKYIYTQSVFFSNSILSQTESMTEKMVSVLEGLAEAGTDIADELVNNLTEGLTASDFMQSVKKYIMKIVVETAVYTGSIKDRIATIGSYIARYIADGVSDEAALADIKEQLAVLYAEASVSAQSIQSIFDSVFGKTESTATTTTTTTTDTVETKVETMLSRLEDKITSFTDSLKDIGTGIADKLVSGLEDGLSTSDFLATIKSYINEMVVQAAVYTESMKSELASIGQAIADGIANGFTESSMSAIKNRIASLYETAGASASKAQSILDSVFGKTETASSTTSATGYTIQNLPLTLSAYASGGAVSGGISLVGEQGPELVNLPRGSYVHSAGETRQMVNNNKSNTFVFNSPSALNQNQMLSAMKQSSRMLAVAGVL